MQVLILSFLMWAGADLQTAMTGQWVGVLEYRDYSEPAGSAKRVKLPTWLAVEAAGPDLKFKYVYDDGPTKTVTEVATVHVDEAAGTYVVTDAKGKPELARVAGMEKLKEGRGTLVLSGTGEENNARVEVRTTLRVGRNILEITRETAAAGQPFTFRHSYTMVRAAVPKS